MARRPQYIFLLAALLAAVPACTGLGPASGNGPLAESVVHISAVIDDASVATKGTGAFVNGSNYGIFSCVHEESPSAFEPFKPTLFNVRANKRQPSSGSNPNSYYYPDGWGYNYIHAGADLEPGTPETGTNAGSNCFTLTQRQDDQHADLYAYAPWNQAAYLSGPTAIPFETSARPDLMYAQENGIGNRDMDPAAGGLSATFTFKHAMARLVFRFKLRHDYDSASKYLINTVDVARLDESVPLCISGTFNAVTGSFADKETASTLRLTSATYAEVVSKDTWASMSVLLVPMDITADGQLSFSFVTSGGVLKPYVLKLAHVQHGTSGVYGFQGGYTYTFDFLLDNYLYLDGFSVNTTWEDDVPLGGGENI